MLRPLYLDLITGKHVAGVVQPPGTPNIYDFDVIDDLGTSQFVFESGVMNGGSIVEVKVNGRELREGASFDFQRDVTNHLISFNQSVPKTAWVRVKIYPS